MDPRWKDVEGREEVSLLELTTCGSGVWSGRLVEVVMQLHEVLFHGIMARNLLHPLFHFLIPYLC